MLDAYLGKNIENTRSRNPAEPRGTWGNSRFINGFLIIFESEPYNATLLNVYLQSLLRKHLDWREYEVLRLSYGLDCDKRSAKEIAEILGIKGTSSYVRISQLKKQAITKLIENVPHSQVIDYL